MRWNRRVCKLFVCPLGLVCVLAGIGIAQNRPLPTAQHVGFDSPEGWALKYFTSETMLSGLEPPETSVEERRVGSIAVGIETGWLPTLSADQARVGFSGRKNEDINKSQIFARPVVRVGLPWRFTLVAAAPLPASIFGVRPHLFALGLERPILQRNQWRLGWRLAGQLGDVTGAFTCPQNVLAFPPGSPNNSTGCIAQSADAASLRYVGTEFQFSYRIPRIPKLIPHLSGGVNFIDSKFRVDAPLTSQIDRTGLWTRGTTFSGSAGLSYLVTKRISFTVDAFYSPLEVQRNPLGPTANDGLFNLRALVSYTLR